MKQSKTFIPTMRQTPADAELRSHQLLLRAGCIKQTDYGVYTYLTLAQKTLRKIQEIVRQEMEAIECIEISMPTLQSSNVWKEVGRTGSYGKELFFLEDRHAKELVLSPSDEERMISLLRDEVNSYKRLPLTLFQMKTKFRDVERPRNGLLYSREFIMNDAYSFHASEESLDEKYEQIMQAFTNILTRLGVQSRMVMADREKETHEFIALSSAGEEKIAHSDSSSYAATIDLAEVNMKYELSDEKPQQTTKVATPNQRTVEDVASFLSVELDKIIKSLLYMIDGESIMVICCGNHYINEKKLQRALHATQVELASEQQVKELLGCSVGSVGPVKLPVGVKVYADHAVIAVVNGVTGANEDDYHLTNVNPERDFAIDDYLDIRYVQEGDASPDGIGTIQFTQGIGIGKISKQGTEYSKRLKGMFLNDRGRTQPFIMGRYELSISRLLAAIAEQYNDDRGLKWPKHLAPFDIHLVAVNLKDEVQQQLADELYAVLQSYRYDVLYDDRAERAGVKFADSDLIGIPVRITVGKRADEGIVEVTFRHNGDSTDWQKEEVLEKLQSFFSAE
ncbi:proline--tRNA ligase [Sporosarcina sp. PTS2304]|uniref:proline--tRNA ligase n=1 Tax=Sporosarcina sp. PTS2304 TaxID=2283194 RepID=UPI000E0D0014|nr:proline--tRNA ligase [Sporosarcina sp. PTS2304]AXH98734.1 proline--tRNA ligase [Sporosarcina sp. PTS2304]